MNTAADLTIDDLGRLTGGRPGIFDVACPSCGPGRRAPHNRIRKVMRVWDDGDGFVTYHCERCGLDGYATDERAKGRQKPNKRPLAPVQAADTNNRVALTNLLWSRARPALGTLTETYLRTRHCWLDCPNIRFLPARDEYDPTMVTRFGEGKITGVHLTRLKRDGTGKAGTDKDKIMIGPTKGQPIIVQDNPERGECVITEGIEDAASWAIATGWTSWAAGSAGRIPAVVEAAARFEKVYISLDEDDAGLASLAALIKTRPDAIIINCNKTGAGADANKIMIAHGPEKLLGCLIRAELQHNLGRGAITPEAFDRELIGIANL